MRIAMKQNFFLPSLLAFFSGAACSGSPAPKLTTIDTKQKVEANAASTAEPGTFSLAVLEAPAKYAIDGDIGEWGSLLPKVEPPKPPKDDKVKEAEPATPAKRTISARDAESHVAISMTSSEVVIVAELGESAAKLGMLLGVASTPPAIPDVGEWGRGTAVWSFDCEFEHKGISDGSWIIGERNPPEVIEACQQLEKNHEVFVKNNEKRFRRFYQINQQGIAVMMDGKPQPIAGAKTVFKPRGKNAIVEISVPFTALPRVGEMPLASIKLAARLAEADGIAALDAELETASFTVPHPVSFGANAELIKAAIAAEILEPTRPPGLSFQPGDPDHFEAMGYEGDPSTVKPLPKTLFGKIATLGDIEVGHVPADGLSVATLKGGKLLTLFPVENDYNTHRPMKSGGMVERNGEVHVFVFYEFQHSVSQGPLQPGWSVAAVSRDGTVRQAVECSSPYGNWYNAWETMSDDKATFAFRGSLWRFATDSDEAHRNPNVEIQYRWDATQKIYTCTETVIKKATPYTAKTSGRKPTAPSAVKNALDDLPGLTKRPTNWAGLKEITVTGSSAFQCVTQVMGPKNGAWFRAHCTGDSVLDVAPLRGHRRTQTSINVSGGKAEILTPIAEGTETIFKMNFEKAGLRFMTIRWKRGEPMPSGIIGGLE